MTQVEVYPGQLLWADGVACAPREDGPYVPAEVPEGSGTWMCLLNEARTRKGKYEIFHYLMKDYHDDGPPGIDQIVEACRLIDEKLKEGVEKLTIFVPNDEKLAWHRHFSALCVAAHRVLVKNESVDAALAPFAGQKINFYLHSWAHISGEKPPRTLPMEIFLRALELAKQRGWLDYAAFDTQDFRERWHKYDVSWFVPGELQIAADPMSTIEDPDPATAKYLCKEQGEPAFDNFFQADSVSLLIRLNFGTEPGLKKSYDPSVFVPAGIDHLDGSYDDIGGGVPGKFVLQKILQKSDRVPDGKVITFHCKAGFGRSAVCAAVVCIHRHDLPGDVVLAWLRLCRPGSITTAQQARFLQKLTCRADVEAELKPEPACCVIC